MATRQLSPSKSNQEVGEGVEQKESKKTTRSSKESTVGDKTTKHDDSCAGTASVACYTSGLPRLVKDPKPYASPLDFLTPCPWELPTKHNAITNFDVNIIARDALETVVVMHPRLPRLVTAFVQLKGIHGSDIEKAMYKDMSQHDLVARLVEKRCLHFVNAWDYTVLRDCTNAKSKDSGLDAIEWLRVGQPDEHLNKYIKMEDYMTYDEMMLSSLIGSSGPTFFYQHRRPRQLRSQRQVRSIRRSRHHCRSHRTKVPQTGTDGRRTLPAASRYEPR